MAAGSISGAERVWDPLVRLTHWSIAAAVVVNGLLVEEGSLVHIWIGYAAFAVLALRLVWGVIGAEEARFTAFPPSLSAARAHIADILAGRHRDYRSHNPVGSLMIYAMWAMLLVVVVTGVTMESDPFPPGASLATAFQSREHHGAEDRAGHGAELGSGEADDEGAGADADEEGEEREGGEQEEEGVIGEIHGTAANLLLIFAAVHVSGVLLESRRSGVNLVRAMLAGSRARQGGG